MGELLGLKWEDVNFKDKTVFVCRAKVKGRIKGTKTISGERKITLEPQAFEALINQLIVSDGWTLDNNEKDN